MIPPVRTDPVWDSGVGLSPVQFKWKIGLDRTTDCQSWTGQAWSGPVHICWQFWHCFIVKYHRKHDLFSHLMTTHLWIPTLGEIMTVLSVYSVLSRCISQIIRPIQWEIYPNPGHSAGLIHTSPVQSRPGPTELWIGPIPVQDLLGLDWTGLGRTWSGLVHCWTGGIIALSLLGSMLPSSLSRGKTLPISPDYMLPYMLLGIRSRVWQRCSHQAPGDRWWVVGSGWHIVAEIVMLVNIKVWTLSSLCPPQWDLTMPHSHGIGNHNYRFCRKNWKLDLGTQIF